MQKKVYVLLCLLCFFALNAAAQYTAEERWHKKGIVMLLNGTVHKGQLFFSLKNNQVQVRADGKLLSYSSGKVEYFEFYDEEYKYQRLFYALPYTTGKNYQSLVFFELLASGDQHTLLCREELTREFTNVDAFGYYFYGSPRLIHVLRHDYFLLNPKTGIAEEFDPTNRKQFEEVTAPHTEAVYTYMRDNRLLPQRHWDVVKIFKFLQEKTANP